VPLHPVSLKRVLSIQRIHFGRAAYLEVLETSLVIKQMLKVAVAVVETGEFYATALQHDTHTHKIHQYIFNYQKKQKAPKIKANNISGRSRITG